MKGAGLIAGLILAAGQGTRFGEEPKLLAELDGRPLLEHAIRAQCEVAQLEKVIVVLGALAAQLLARVDFGRATPVICDRWQEGQAASLRCGIRALGNAHKAVVTLGDQPLISAAVIARFAGEPAGTRATYNGRRGHPVVLGRDQFREIARLTGDAGARDLLRGGRVIECADLCSDRDVDTPADLEAIRVEARAVV